MHGAWRLLISRFGDRPRCPHADSRTWHGAGQSSPTSECADARQALWPPFEEHDLLAPAWPDRLNKVPPGAQLGDQRGGGTCGNAAETRTASYGALAAYPSVPSPVTGWHWPTREPAGSARSTSPLP